MKRYRFYYIFLIICFLYSCQDETDKSMGYGYLQISSIGLDKTVVPQSRSNVAEVLALDIMKDGVVMKHVDDWTSLGGESLLLPTGNYILKAYSANKDSMVQGLEALPYYLGERSVNIEKNVAKPVEIVCSLWQSMVTLSFSDNFKKAFPIYQCEVRNSDANAVFASTETRSAYFRAGKSLTAALSMTNADGKSFSYDKLITANAQSRYHYKVTYDVTNEGTGDFTFTVDQTTYNYDIHITVPLNSEADSKLHTVRAEAWGEFAYLYGSSELEGETEPIQFQYKKVAETTWESVAATWVEGAYTAKTAKLDFGTGYNYRIVCGTKVGNTDVFTTEIFQEIPNLNFDTWSKSGSNWYANPVANNYDDAQAYWATGNEGVTSFLAGSKPPITVPTEGDDAYRGKAAKLVTLTGITLVGSAAGNLFVGKYKTNMTSPASSVSFGRPYTGARPVSLSGYYKYLPKPINNGTKPGNLTTDQCNVYVKLWDANGNEIGFGEFVGVEEVSAYTKFSFDISYSNTVAKPAKIAIVATSSRYGGEFEGSKVVGQVGGGSTLWIDEFELSYYK